MNLVHAGRSGILAGSVGTIALNLVTYVDMLVRGRPASTTPIPATRAKATDPSSWGPPIGLPTSWRISSSE